MKRNLERGPVQVKERVVRDPSIRTGLDNSMEQCDIAAQLQRGNGLVGTFAAQDTPRGPRLQKLFNLMDSNKDGHIDEMEGVAIGRLLFGGNAKSGMEFWQQLLSQSDFNQNRKIELHEYLQYCRSLSSGRDAREVAQELEQSIDRLEVAKARESLQRRQMQ